MFKPTWQIDPLYSERYGQVDLDGEDCRGLWAAVLERARYDVRHECDRIRRPAYYYLVSGSTHTGSFLWVCDELGLDLDKVRRRFLDGAVEPAPRLTACAGDPVGLELRTWREEHGITQIQVGRTLGCTNVTVHALEAGLYPTSRFRAAYRQMMEHSFTEPRAEA